VPGVGQVGIRQQDIVVRFGVGEPVGVRRRVIQRGRDDAGIRSKLGAGAAGNSVDDVGFR